MQRTAGPLLLASTRDFQAPVLERWLNTGDLCTVDADGHVWPRVRSKDAIVRGGRNIDPLVIEDALPAHPAVMLAAIGAPHRDEGKVPVAYVQLHTGKFIGDPGCLRTASVPY